MSVELLAQVKHLRIGPGWVLEGDKKVKVPAIDRKAALFLLAEYGTTMVPQYRLAAELEVSVRTCRRILHSLVADGFISRESRYGGPEIRRSDVIRLTLPATCGPQVAATCGRKEPTTEPTTEKSPALLGPVEGKLDMNSESDSCNDGLVIDVRDHPTRPKAPRPAEKWNPVTLAQHFTVLARRHQWGHPGALSGKALAGTYRRWHHDHGVCYREIAAAIDLFFEQLPPELEAPAGRLFIKQGFQWISAAKEHIYQEELPAKQAANRAMWDQIQADLDMWVSENPGVSQGEKDAMTAALWQTWKQDPRYAISYS